MQRSMAYSKPNHVIDVGCKKKEENQGLQGSTGGIVLCEAKKAPAQGRSQKKGASDYSYGAVQWSDVPNKPSFFK